MGQMEQGRAGRQDEREVGGAVPQVVEIGDMKGKVGSLHG